MKPDEKYALETLVDKYGGEYIKGDEPPDGYLVTEEGERIAVEVTRLIQHVTENNCFTQPRLADDEPGHNILDQLDIELKNKIPTDKYVFIILPTPVNNVRKTKTLLSSKILDLINSSATEAEFNVCSNYISVSVYSGERGSGKKVAGALPNTRSSADIGANVSYLLNDRITEKERKRENIPGISEYWLALINQYWIADESSYQLAYISQNIQHGFDRVLLINDRKGVHELFKKI